MDRLRLTVVFQINEGPVDGIFTSGWGKIPPGNMADLVVNGKK